MDARAVLGVAVDADAAAVRAAYRRLTRQLDPARGGTTALVDVVRAAYDQLGGSSRTVRTTVPDTDPYRILDVPRSATEDDVRLAYRRLAARVHPDRGGSDELFRLVAAACDAILRPAATARAAARRRADDWPRPRPERPYRPPPIDARFHAPGWRDWALVLTYSAGLAAWIAAAALIVVALDAAEGQAKVVFLVLLPAWGVLLGVEGRRPVGGLLRALARARASYARQRGADPEAFLADRCLDSPVNREREDTLYSAYHAWCRDRRARPLSRWVFIEKLRTLGLLHVQASTMDVGLFVGIRLRV